MIENEEKEIVSFLGADLLVFNQDPRVVHLLRLVQSYVDFVGQLRDYLSTSTIEIKPLLAKSLISLLQQPLALLSYEPIKDQESSSFTSVRPLLDCLFTLTSNPIQLIDINESQSILIYFIFTKNPYFSSLPSVYSPVFHLLLSIPSLHQLSEHRDQVMLTEKACVLVSQLCSRLTPDKQFDETFLDNDRTHLLIDTLKILMVQSPARYTFLQQQQLAKTTHSDDSYRTFLCTLLKDEFFQDYRFASTEIYKGIALFQLLDHLCRLPNGVESDLLEIYDCLCSTLNFIRFIGLVDKRNVNRTLLWTDRLNHLNETLFKPLRKSIDLARAHYKLEIKNKNDDKNQKQQPTQGMDTEILLDNAPLPIPSHTFAGEL